MEKSEVALRGTVPVTTLLIPGTAPISSCFVFFFAASSGFCLFSSFRVGFYAVPVPPGMNAIFHWASLHVLHPFPPSYSRLEGVSQTNCEAFTLAGAKEDMQG